jgi:ribonucleoside-diphosphate reductase alpha chain
LKRGIIQYRAVARGEIPAPAGAASPGVESTETPLRLLTPAAATLSSVPFWGYPRNSPPRGLHHKVVIVQAQTQPERVGSANTYGTHGALAYALRAEDEGLSLGSSDVNARDGASAAFFATHLSVPSGRPGKAGLLAEARAKGYEGEACGTCSNFTLVRNGTCLKCDTCGGTTGRS